MKSHNQHRDETTFINHVPLFILYWVVCAFADEQRPKTRDERQEQRQEPSVWKTFAVFSGAILQLGGSIVGFGILGHYIGAQTHHVWLTILGVMVGVVVGASGLAFLAKQILGDRP
ncbi:hypothetical protein C7445_103145 [Alicyclobacillus sacchari]|uniref:Uncharacterized protein n=1 Tax=Alicyclobacillus sacchari TaxID=392010 RepID=A0A4R8LR97_9BACL|nr:hypothetical protein [Alicyclobacillus sacchari]TDY50100.1 hypothetical protein C7445_103145 [Alicyclobacillus sacchari]GMA57546.1 hypothetical protein GCM10025858_20490 [Alicyclobacillus sacchari]